MNVSFLNTRAGPSGIQYFNRFNGLTVLVNEAIVPQSKWSKAPRHVSIALTNECDLQCAHCFVERTSASLDADKVAQWLLELDSHGCLSVGFGGGEPTLHPDFVALCQFTAEKTRLALTCTTHGHVLDDAIMSSIGSSINFIRISMDGVGQTYERIRGKPFDVLCSQIEMVSKYTKIGINYLVNSATITDLDQAVTLAENMGASQFLLLPEQSAFGQGGIDNGTNLKLREWVQTCCTRVPLAVSEQGSLGLPTCDPLAEEGGLRAYAHVDAEGVLKASSFESDGVSVGSGSLMTALKELSGKRR